MPHLSPPSALVVPGVPGCRHPREGACGFMRHTSGTLHSGSGARARWWRRHQICQIGLPMTADNTDLCYLRKLCRIVGVPSDEEITFADHAGGFYARRYGMAPMVGRLL